MAKQRFASLVVEPLEPRLALAGNVTAVMSGTTLKIGGDDSSNAVNIYQLNATQIRIEGTTDAINATTTVNGAAFQDFTFGAGNSLEVELKGGDDIVNLGNAGPVGGVLATAVNKLSLDLGAGGDRLIVLNTQVGNGGNTASINLGRDDAGDNDLLSIKQTQFAGHVKVLSGGGADGLEFDNLTVAKHLTVEAGVGDDSVSFNAVTADRLTLKLGEGHDGLVVTGGLNVNMTGNKTILDGAGGDDTVQITGALTAKNSIVLSLGEGANTVNGTGSTVTGEKGLTITGGGSTDAVTFATIRGPAVKVELNAGGDSFTATDVAGLGGARAKIDILMGADNDTVSLSNVVAGNLTINLGEGAVNQLTANTVNALKTRFDGGAGADTANLTNFTSPDLQAFFNGGNDVATLNTVTVLANLNFNGGTGANTLNETAFTKPANPKKNKVTGF